MNECCALCQKGDTPLIAVKEKGLRTLVRISKENGLDDLYRLLILSNYTVHTNMNV